MVSPSFKDGWRVFPAQFSLDGENVVGSSFGAFAGGTSQEGIADQYEFTRSSTGWVTTPLEPPASQFAELSNAEFSNGPDIDSADVALFTAHLATQSVFDGDLYLREPDGSFGRVGPMLPASAVPLAPTGTGADSEGEQIAGASSDLSHILFSIEAGRQPAGVTTNLWPGDGTTAGSSLYEYLGASHTGEGDDVPDRLGVDNTGGQISDCGTNVAVSPTIFAPGISTAGSTVLFTTAAGPCEGGGTGPAVDQLYARIGNSGETEATVNLAGTSDCASSEECNVTAAPVYQGASADGSKVFFTTTQPLSESDHDAANDIYECELPGDAGSTPAPVGIVNGCPSLHPVSVTGTTEGAKVQSVVAISDDGSHVYFTAEGVLTGNEKNGNKEEAIEGAHNLYVNNTLTGTTAFIGRLSSAEPSAQTTPEGHFLVFSDAADLTPDDSSTVEQIFEYDADAPSGSAESLVRVSIGDQGFNEDGNTHAEADAASLAVTDGQNIGQSSHPDVSNDGSKVIFTSADGLTPQALDEALRTGSEGRLATNVYEYTAGSVYLISDGVAANVNQDTELVGIDGSGRDIYFGTVDSLVPQDTDELFDIYDAREEGGFPAPTAPAECLTGDSCQGPLSPSEMLPAAGSTNAASHNLAPLPPAPVTKPKPKPLTRAQKLAKALKACPTKRNRHERASCESQARRKYGPKAKTQARKSASERGRTR